MNNSLLHGVSGTCTSDLVEASQKVSDTCVDAGLIAVSRATKETDITCKLRIHGSGKAGISSGLGFFDHMLTSLTVHAGFDLQLTCTGDLQVDDHHTVEDCAIVLGQALLKARTNGAVLQRYGWSLIPMDEALARAAVDLCGRPCGHIELGLAREMLGGVACENFNHFFTSLAHAAMCCMHIDVLRGDNDHHRIEAAFKALAYALRQAYAHKIDKTIASTKGVLS